MEVTVPNSLPRACKAEIGNKVGPLMSCNIPVRDLRSYLALPPDTHSLGPRVEVGVSNNPCKECIGTHQEIAWPDLMGLGPDGCQDGKEAEQGGLSSDCPSCLDFSI